MKAKHTPGPLSIKPAKDGSGDYAIISDEGHGLIAECFADMRYANERATEIAKANASFFAAAPDLLDALRMAREFISTDRAGLADTSFWHDGSFDVDDAKLAALADYDAALAQIDDALGKALGNEA